MKWSKTFIPTFLLISLSIGSVPVAGEQGIRPGEISASVIPSLLSLDVKMPDGRVVAGTGFLTLKDGIIATVWDRVKEARGITARFSNGEEYECSGIIDKDEKRNVALVRIKVFGKPVLKMEPVEPDPGREVAIAAVKEGAFGIIIANVAGWTETDGIKVGRLTGDITGDISGSPVLDGQGRIVGLLDLKADNGGSDLYFLPAAYLMALDQTLPTQPWIAVQDTDASPVSVPGAASVYPMLSDEEIDARLARALVAFVQFAAAYNYAADLNDRYGFREDVPQELYAMQNRQSAAIETLVEARTRDNSRATVLKGVLRLLQTMQAAGELFIQASIIGRQNDGEWDGAPGALQQKYNVLVLTVADIRSALRSDLMALEDASPAFLGALPMEVRYFMDLTERPSGYDLGVEQFPEDPFFLLNVERDGLGHKIGLRTGDRILSCAGRTFAVSDDFEDFKLLIKENLRNILAVEVERENKHQILQLKIPKSIPKKAIYKP